MEAAANGDARLVGILIDAGADYSAATKPRSTISVYGITALMKAAAEGHTEIHPSLADRRGRTGRNRQSWGNRPGSSGHTRTQLRG